MPTTSTASNHETAELEKLMAKTKKKSDFQRVQCVFLRARYNLKATEVAKITGQRPGTVRQVWSLYRREGKNALFCKTRGGRRNAHLSRDQEKLFLRPFFKKAEHGGELVVAEVHEAYESLIGKKVPKSTLYRILSRHGWRRKPGRATIPEAKGGQRPGMHDYWIEGCSHSRPRKLSPPPRTPRMSKRHSPSETPIKTRPPIS